MPSHTTRAQYSFSFEEDFFIPFVSRTTLHFKMQNIMKIIVNISNIGSETQIFFLDKNMFLMSLTLDLVRVMVR